MTRKISAFFVFLMMSNGHGQDESDFLHNKEFIALVGNAYEETPEPNPCAGQEIYLILKFSKEEVSIIQKAISSCGEEKIEHEFHQKWKFSKNKEIKVFFNSNEIKHTYFENLKLEVRESTVLGSIVYPNNQKDLFAFSINHK